MKLRLGGKTRLHGSGSGERIFLKKIGGEKKLQTRKKKKWKQKKLIISREGRGETIGFRGKD